MGSRAVVVVPRDAARRAALRCARGASGAIYTRTGRPFFNPALTEELLSHLRHAAEMAGLYEELDTDWLLLDAEILPWSAKALDLLKSQYASVGAAARASLPVAVALLRQAQSSGVATSELLARTESRMANASAFTEAYGRYCWPTDGLTGVAVAPFQVLAGEGATYHDQPHSWHLDIIDKLVAADPEVLRVTRRRFVDTTDPSSVSQATAWWEELTGAGGEGMVVKPARNVVARADVASCSPGSRSADPSTCGSSTAPTTPSRQTSSGFVAGVSGTNAPLPRASTRWGSRRSNAPLEASRSGASTNASSRSWRSSRSRSTRDSDPRASPIGRG